MGPGSAAGLVPLLQHRRAAAAGPPAALSSTSLHLPKNGLIAIPSCAKSSLLPVAFRLRRGGVPTDSCGRSAWACAASFLFFFAKLCWIYFLNSRGGEFFRRRCVGAGPRRLQLSRSGAAAVLARSSRSPLRRPRFICCFLGKLQQQKWRFWGGWGVCGCTRRRCCCCVQVAARRARPLLLPRLLRLLLLGRASP